ncbi:MAG: glycoside hydrolase family 32 protein [Lachnospiraceae bacterium]|nr:glycoside hydrolase family 32 protein [Lachnospiraceae bacterium]
MNQKNVESKYRLYFHLMPPMGWLNDPNGLCYYKEYYHVFFQYSPEDPRGGGQKCWGHYRSKDLVQWEYLGITFIPDRPEDKDGVYSGSAFVEDGALEVFYTGNVKEPGEHDYIYTGRGANVIYARSEDGTHFSEKEILLTNEDYPGEYTCHIRDPKVWRDGEYYYMVLGGRKGQPGDSRDTGAVLLYQSRDKRNWSFMQDIEATDDLGYMWECPDYFQMGGVKILSICPQGRTVEADRFQNGDSSGYLFLPKGWQSEVAESEFREWDKGFDFYAPQTFLDQHNRRILIGWVGLPDPKYTNESSIQEGWQHCLTVPRELTLGESIRADHSSKMVILQNPVKEIEKLHGALVCIDQYPATIPTGIFDGIFSFADGSEEKQITINEELIMEYGDGQVTLRFANLSGEGRGERIAQMGGLRNLRILKDISVVEYFLNDGEVVFTTRYYPEDTQQTTVSVQGQLLTSKIWEMKSGNIWMNENR